MVRLDETHVLDESNVRGAGYKVDFVAPDKELKESQYMAFDEEDDRINSGQNNQKLININELGGGSGLAALSRLASVNITEFDWKYET